MRFYDCTVAPSPRRVRIFLAEKGLSLDTVQVDLLNGENLKPDYLALNPRGVVPLLKLDDGTAIDESFSICRYLEELHPEPNLMGRDARERALIDSVNRHVEWDGFLPGAEAFRNAVPGFADRGIPGVTGVPAIPALAERGRAGLLRFFDRLEQRLSGHPFVAGERYTIADITAMCVVDFAGWVKLAVPEAHANTRKWYGSVSSRPSAKA